MLLVWASPASLSLAGKEHGRTIPFPDIGAATAHLARGLSGDGKPQGGTAEALRCRRIGLAEFLKQFGL